MIFLLFLFLFKFVMMFSDIIIDKNGYKQLFIICLVESYQLAHVLNYINFFLFSVFVMRLDVHCLVHYLSQNWVQGFWGPNVLKKGCSTVYFFVSFFKVVALPSGMFLTSSYDISVLVTVLQQLLI